MQKYVIALYIRLSLEDYKYDSMSIENQHLALNEFVSSMPESTHAEVLEFIDNGYSGTNFERPKVQELIEMVRANKIDCIIVCCCHRPGKAEARRTGPPKQPTRNRSLDCRSGCADL